MNTHWTYKPYTTWRGFKAYLLGMLEFRSDFTTSFFDPDLMNAYDSGRDMAHQLTLRRYDESV